MATRQQQGIALITVLLVLAIATVTLVSMSTSRQIDIRRTENLLRASQAFEHVYSLEIWASHELQQDSSDKIDGVADSWAQPISITAPQGGQIDAAIIDLQSRFNVNNLLSDNEPNQRDVARFKRLLALLDIEPGLVDAILDWQDSNSDIRYPEGAEDETYLRETPPYRSGNRMFADVSELLLVKGMGRDDYEALLPYIYVTDGYAPININTASALILQCLAEKLSKDDAEALVQAASGKPFAKVQDFLKQEELKGLGINEEGLDVSSHDFLLTGNVKIGRLNLAFTSQLKRLQGGKINLVKRQRRSPVNG